MSIKLVQQLDNMLADDHELKCFDTKIKQFVELPHANFLDMDSYLPSLFKTEKGYRSPVVVVLTSRPTVYGKTLGVSTGYVMIPNEDITESVLDDAEWIYADSWHASCGEEVVGWMPPPQFHDGEQVLEPYHDPNGKFYFNYKAL
jgi:hypothetical protein